MLLFELRKHGNFHSNRLTADNQLERSRLFVSVEEAKRAAEENVGDKLEWTYREEDNIYVSSAFFSGYPRFAIQSIHVERFNDYAKPEPPKSVYKDEREIPI